MKNAAGVHLAVFLGFETVCRTSQSAFQFYHHDSLHKIYMNSLIIWYVCVIPTSNLNSKYVLVNPDISSPTSMWILELSHGDSKDSRGLQKPVAWHGLAPNSPPSQVSRDSVHHHLRPCRVSKWKGEGSKMFKYEFLWNLHIHPTHPFTYLHLKFRSDLERLRFRWAAVLNRLPPRGHRSCHCRWVASSHPVEHPWCTHITHDST